MNPIIIFLGVIVPIVFIALGLLLLKFFFQFVYHCYKLIKEYNEKTY